MISRPSPEREEEDLCLAAVDVCDRDILSSEALLDRWKQNPILHGMLPSTAQRIPSSPSTRPQLQPRLSQITLPLGPFPLIYILARSDSDLKSLFEAVEVTVKRLTFPAALVPVELPTRSAATGHFSCRPAWP
jgi:hypothetical protein